MRRSALFLLSLLASFVAQAQFYAPYHPLNGSGQPRYFGIVTDDSTLIWDQLRAAPVPGRPGTFAAAPRFWDIGVGMTWYGDTLRSLSQDRIGIYHQRRLSYWIKSKAGVGDTLLYYPPSTATSPGIAVRVDTIAIETLHGLRDTVKASWSVSGTHVAYQNALRLHRTAGWVIGPGYAPAAASSARFAETAEGYPARFRNYGAAEALAFSVGDEVGFTHRLVPEGPNGWGGYLTQHTQRMLRIDTVSADSLTITLQDSAQLVHRLGMLNLPDSTGQVEVDTLVVGLHPQRYTVFDKPLFDTAGQQGGYLHNLRPQFAGTTIENKLGRARFLDQDYYFEGGTKTYYYNGWPLPFSFAFCSPGACPALPLFVGDVPQYFRLAAHAGSPVRQFGTRPAFITATRPSQSLASLRLTPNPARNIVTLIPPGSAPAMLHLYNAQGALCKSLACSGTLQLERGSLPPGLYLLVWTSGRATHTARLLWE